MLLLLFVNNESESSESPFIQTFLDVPKIKGFFSKTNLNDNDKPSDPAKNNNYMCDNQVYDLITETEPIKMFIKEQLYVIKKSISDISNQSEQQNKEVIELLQEQNKILIEENKSKTTIIELLVESQNKSRNDQKPTKKFEIVNHRKYCKPRSNENEPINCHNRYETLCTDTNDEESEN